MGDSPIELIEKYLERVKIFLPFDSEEVLAEMRTHLIEEAETLGEGQLTHGSVMLAIERFGDPKDAANAWAGTGKKVGPIPAEYVTPVLRIALALIALCAIFLVGASVVGVALPDVVGVINFPASIATMVIISLIYASIIIAGISYLDRSKSPTEMRVIESVLGLGSDAFKAKSKSDAAVGFFFGMALTAVAYNIIFASPVGQEVFTPESMPFLAAGIVLAFAEGIMNLMFFLFGENNINLLTEALIGAAWVILCMFLINITFPLLGVYAYDETTGWFFIGFAELAEEFPNGEFVPFDLIWAGIIFVIVITNLWGVLMASMKIPMYLNAGRGWWWRGEFGNKKRWRKYRQAKEPRASPTADDRHSGSNY